MLTLSERMAADGLQTLEGELIIDELQLLIKSARETAAARAPGAW